jgi:cell division septum initiation protein DivIVA
MQEGTVVSEVSYLLEKLESLVKSARRLPWGRQVLVDQEQMSALVDGLRHALPEAVRQAQWVVQERERLIADAGRDADEIIHAAQERAVKMAGDSEVTRAAEQRARDLVHEAEQRAQEIHAGAIAYADDVLGRLERDVSRMLASVRQDRESLNPEAARQTAK